MAPIIIVMTYLNASTSSYQKRSREMPLNGNKGIISFNH